MNTTNHSEKPDFSLALGGPLFQLLRRTYLSGDALELLHRRILVISLVAWLPLLFLSVLDGHAIGSAVRIPFLYDIDTHVRFLIALPGLIACELIVHLRLGPAVRQFEERGIVVKEELPKFNAIIGSVMRMRNSVTLEAALLILAYSIGPWAWQIHVAPGAATWYTMSEETHLHLTPAGYWYAFAQHSDLSVHAVAVVRAALSLDLVSVAYVEVKTAANSNGPGSNRWTQLPG